jgi:signal transduction histidine kinase
VFILGALLQVRAGSDIESLGVLSIMVACVFGSLCVRREQLIGLAILLTGSVWVVIRTPADLLQSDARPDELSRTSLLVSTLIQYALVWSLAWVVSRRVRSTRALRARAATLEAERERVAAQAVAEERGRIARELHDVVAHNVSVMVVQAGGVRRLLQPDQVREREALETIELTGRRALTEMRRLVGVMRSNPNTADREPQPGLGSVDRLLEEIRNAGLPAKLEVTGTRVDLPPGLDLSAYRIVQEALTNALKHAGPAHATVTLNYGRDTLEIDITDDGLAKRTNGSGGHGLIGMRERVGLYGGELEAGPQPEGGFRLRARLPIDPPNGGAVPT